MTKTDAIEEILKEIGKEKDVYVLDIHNVKLKKRAYDIIVDKHQRCVCNFCGNSGDIQESFYGSVEVISFISDDQLKEAYEVVIYCKSCLSFINSFVIPSKDVYKAYLEENPEEAKNLLIKIRIGG